MVNYDCFIETISPIHIGNGKSYFSSEYLPSRHKKKNSSEEFETIYRINVSKYYSSLTEDKREELVNGLSEPNFTLKDFDSKIKNEFRRYLSINKCEGTPKQIQEHIKTMDELYIPGSSIKGSIKTALFYSLVNSKTMSEIWYRLNESKGKGLDKKQYSYFIDSFFSSRGNAAQKSIMKYLQISDTSTRKIPTIYDIFSIKAKSDGTTESHTTKHGNTVYNYIETIDKNVTLSFNINIDFNEKIISKINLENKKDIINLDYIKKAIYTFSADLIDYELDFADKYGVDSLTKFYEKLNKRNSEDKPLMKIGSGSGFMATTIGMKIKEYDPILFKGIAKNTPKSYAYEFPKSRKIIKKLDEPLGWVQLTI